MSFNYNTKSYAYWTKAARRWACLVRESRLYTSIDAVHCMERYHHAVALSAYYLRAASGAPVIVDAPAVDYTVWDY